VIDVAYATCEDLKGLPGFSTCPQWRHSNVFRSMSIPNPPTVIMRILHSGYGGRRALGDGLKVM
jgi:hypothetical protein